MTAPPGAIALSVGGQTLALAEPRPRRGSLNHFHVRALGHVSLIGRCLDTRIKCSVVFLH